ncbi:alpha/beta fold hydrolase [Nostoc sp.]|uniref:alpha/beta fold hydrolase n=1 Tax=Nostoc sp. TaxID=1180 RepID=UPI002FF4DF30
MRFLKQLKTLDDKIRANIDGSFIKLSDGVVHYELAGENNKQPVVLIHGFSTPYFIWDSTIAALVEAGFLVLRYDLYGRGYSDRPNTIYNADLFDRQLLNLLAALEINQPVDLIGLSMGGDIAAIFTHRHFSMVRKLCLIDPACFFQNQSLISRILYSPILGDILMFLLGEKIFLSTIYDDFYRPEKFLEYKNRFLEQLKYKGFKQAIISTYRQMSFNKFSEIYNSLGDKQYPVLLIWGKQDKTIPFMMSEKVKKAIPNVNFYAINEARHVPHYEQPEIVNNILINFL